MKLKSLFTTFCLMLYAIAVSAQSGKEPYVVVKDSTATYYYGTKPDGALGVESSQWNYDTRASVAKVVFHSSFKDYFPTSCAYWFANLKNLTTISGMKDNLNTSNVTDLNSMFTFCKKLANIDVSGFNTTKVENLSYMFSGCESLTSLDLSVFNTANVTNMYDMFNGCCNLKTIFVGTSWTTSSVIESQTMFNLCNNLYGGKGSFVYDYPIHDCTYAKIDGGEENPGFLTKSGEQPFVPGKQAYVEIENGVATFFYDKKTKNAFNLQLSIELWPEEVRNSIFKVVFDESFKSYKPKNCGYWFYNFINLTEISGMKEYLNTSDTWNMSAMFYSCSNLKSIDLSGFNTANVISMYEMFCNCSNLTNLDVSSFNTSKVKDMINMFSNLSVTSLDLSSFSTKNVVEMFGMFSVNPNLCTIYVSDGWGISPVTSAMNMFLGCDNLYGGKGSSVNELRKYDETYAKIDGGESAPGYLTKKGEPAFAKVVAIQVATLPKTQYALGENFSTQDGTLSIQYSTGRTSIIDLSAATISGYDKNKLGEQTVTISYLGHETTLTTPVSEISEEQNKAKVWAYNSIIYLETSPDTKYTIIDLNGRILKSSTTKSTKEEISTKSGIYIVIINGDSYKVSVL